jgi:DNA (cytosine-5)-methyltransferase 1
VLNTKHYGIPQNRERIFIVGFKDFRHLSFPKKIPLDVKLKDILQDEVDNKYYLSDTAIEKINKHNNKTLDKNISNKIVQIKSGALRTHPRTTNPDKDKKEGRSKRLEIRDDGLANSITTHQLDSIVVKDNLESVADYRLDEGLKKRKIRRLTPLECWRLQGFKDNDFYKVKDVSDTQLYKQAGNSITVDVLMHLFKKIYE